jgi:hypothetical protein
MNSFKFLQSNISFDLAKSYDVPPAFRCAGVTAPVFDVETYLPFRYLVFEHIDSGRMIAANVIRFDHPMYNYGREINPDMYNEYHHIRP